MTDRRQATVELERRYARRASEVLERLRRAREADGALTPPGIERVAEAVGLPRAHVNGAATFFADLGTEPVGARHLRVCAGTACFAATGGSHLEQVENLARATGATSQRVHCLGYCYGCPAALDGERPHAGLDLVAQLEDEAPGEDPPIPFRAATDDPILLARLCGEHSPEPWDVYRSVTDPQAVMREVHASGLRGRGGAAFPAAQKWAAAAGARSDGPRYVVCNGDEGDPGSYVDRLLMENDPNAVLEGVALAALAVGAGRAWVYVRSEYPRARDRLREALSQAAAAGVFDGRVTIEIFEGAGSYVAGEETALVHSMEGLRGAAAARPPYPAEQGLYGRPTAVNNVETLAAVPWIVARGGEAYAKRGTEHSRGTKLVCLNERFARPGVYEVELGVTVRRICEELGGGLRDGRRLRSLQVGGPLGGFLSPDQLDQPFSFEGLRAVGVELGHGGLVAFDDGVAGADLLRHLWEFAAAESCGTCFPCRIGSRRGLEMAQARRLDGMGALLDLMQRASLCGFGQGIAAPVRQILRIYGDELGDL